MSEENKPSQQGAQKRDLLKRMQAQLTNYQTFIMDALKQAYSTKFVECSQKSKSQVEQNRCQDTLNSRLNHSLKLVQMGDQPLLAQFKYCVKNAMDEDDMNACFNTMMQAKDENLEKARNLLLE